MIIPFFSSFFNSCVHQKQSNSVYFHDKFLFMWANSGFIVGTGVLDCPLQNKKLHKNHVVEYVNFDKIIHLIFCIARTVEDACPYNHIKSDIRFFP